MDYVQGKRPQPPKVYTLASYTDRWGSPYGGGWLDWPAGLVNQMTTVLAYVKAVQLHDTHSKQKGWTTANRQIMELVTQVWRWRKEAGYSAWM